MPSISDLVTFNLVSLVGKRFNFDWNKCTTGWSSIQPSASYFAETFNKQPQSPSNRWKTSNISKMSTSCLFAFTFLSLSPSLSLSFSLSISKENWNEYTLRILSYKRIVFPLILSLLNYWKLLKNRYVGIYRNEFKPLFGVFKLTLKKKRKNEKKLKKNIRRKC